MDDTPENKCDMDVTMKKIGIIKTVERRSQINNGERKENNKKKIVEAHIRHRRKRSLMNP